MLTLNDGRNELWQWDTGRKLTVDAECSQVHFSNKVFGRSIDVDVVDGIAIIPDILLQTDKELTAWAFAGTAENGYTKISKVFKVNKRNKPADYVFTPTDQTTLGELVERLEKIEETQDPDAIKNAVDDYLASNPIQVEETDPTVPDWAKQPEKPNYTAEEVGALPADTVIPEIPAIPSKLPNPHPLTFTGAVEATYDGSKAVEVAIPQGGGGGSSVGGWKKVAEYVWDGNKEYQPLALDYATGEMVFDTAPPTSFAMWPVPNIDGVSNPVDLHSLYAKIPNEFLNAGQTSGMALSENGYTFGGVTKIAEGGVNANVDVSAFRFEVNNTVPSFSGLNAKKVKISFFAPGGNVWQNNGGFNFNAKLSNGQTVTLSAASGSSRLLYGWYEQEISVENNVLRNYFSLYGRFFKTRTSATQSGTNEKEGSVYPVFAVPDDVTIAEVYFSAGNGSYRPCNGTVVEVYVYED